ncbi:hypothetical protein FEM48_Zijuj04G0079000 [Ziziphus jujuba var. spinosa]|uniref:Apple domain-containing protein n=1 Tax=Ziziphus jujuba var. spinosa TaxID=714518 RepID=A0A978VIP3_ZIZJJ|nr:hypothetical protein FEM48_Zijuj04G0079000 [Ziziphus jujuba var. spinosa]
MSSMSLPEAQQYVIAGSEAECESTYLNNCSCMAYAFDHKRCSIWVSNGYQRKTKLNCDIINGTGNYETDKFLDMSNISLPEARQYVTAGSQAECESTCLNNCSYMAYVFASDRCSIWVGELLNLKKGFAYESNGKPLYVRVAVLELQSPKKSKGRVTVDVVGGASGLAVLLGLIIFVILRQRKKIFRPGKAILEASKIIEGGDVFSLLDLWLEGNADPEELIRVCRGACWCIQYEETQRPSMG